jgi:DNA-binding MarR family transcriptional regulator
MTIPRLLDRLEGLGLAERCTDPKDRRPRLRLPPAGSPILREKKATQHRVGSTRRCWRLSG